MPGTHRVAIVTSRVPRLIGADAPLLRGLRACLRRIAANSSGAIPTSILTVDGTASCDLIRRGCERVGLRWERLCEHPQENPPLPPQVNAPFEPALDGPPITPTWSRDQHLLDAVDEVFALHVRRSGNIEHLLAQSLTQRHRPVWLVQIPDLQSADVIKRLTAAGAVTWQPAMDLQRPLTGSVPEFDSVSPSLASNSTALVEFSPARPGDEVLIHTTRACPGPWPGETAADYYDGLLENRPLAQHTALNTLHRILRQQMLLASPSAIRGGHAVISFTAAGVSNLATLRRFQTHRTRWDFEPFGLCLTRSILEQRGARPVIYGTEEDWRNLSPVDQPYFQLARTYHADGSLRCDWTVEQEWRIAGDLDLTSFSSRDIQILVPDYESACQIAADSLWPMVLWPYKPAAGP